MCGSDTFHQPCHFIGDTQVGLVPREVCSTRPLPAAADCVNFIITTVQDLAQAMRANETGHTRGEKAPLHGMYDAYLASRGAISNGANGQAMPKAGSFQRTPRCSAAS